jgi:hypothetical protein
MSAQKNVLGLVDAGREVRRPALVGVELQHQGPMGTPDLVRPGARLKPQDLVRLLFRHRARLRPAVRPRVGIALSVFTPAGKPAVEIRF